MKKIILTILILLISINNYTQTANQAYVPQENDQLITIWDRAYQLNQQIYIYQDDQFHLLASDQEFLLEDLTDQKIIYYPNLNIYIYTVMREDNNFFGFLEMETEPLTRVEYSLELRVACLKKFIDLSESPALLVLEGSYDSKGKSKKVIYDTQKSGSSPCLSLLDNHLRLDLKIRLWSKTGSVSSFTVGVPINMVH